MTEISEEETPLADTVPVQKNFPWWILLILAAAGITTEEVVRRKTVKAKASNNKDALNK